MGSVFRPTRPDPKNPGKRQKYRRYYITWIDANGFRRKEKAYTDKVASEALLRKKEIEAERIRAGLPVEQQRAMDRPMSEVIQAYLEDLERRGSGKESRHYTDSQRILNTLVGQCEWKSLRDVRGEGLSKFLAGLASQGKAPRTLNRYHETLHQLIAFCISQDWILESPIARVKKARMGERGRRRRRRALSEEEWARLMAVTPEPRRTIYQVAAWSGLRRKELRLLEKRDLTPVGDRPQWHLRPEVDKSRRGDRIPMTLEAAELLRPIWQRLAKASARVFRAVPHVVTLHADLEKAGIPRQDERGRWVDFHSFRYLFCKRLSMCLTIQKVKVLMRHSSLKLTADLYLDLGLDDLAEEVWTLPSLEILPEQDQGKKNQTGQDTPQKAAKGGHTRKRLSHRSAPASAPTSQNQDQEEA